MTTNQSLPITHQERASESEKMGLRKRLSSLSLKYNPGSLSNSASLSYLSWRRSKSMSSLADDAGFSIKKWWNWGWGWILSKKAEFAKDLEMNEGETMLGCGSKGRLSHVFSKVRSEIRRIISPRPANKKFNYDSYSYAQNFDNGGRN
ncbi:hypothetical protein AMTR_s00022p00161350 [Amborella trichopoda]|uniref:Uncharacterized protein n=2 Tax=Amborella trichopoda TaxID=13333 RepID=W1PW72_AMBTC|nr:hypothetical protein AMTR_s00022p00161350 [Amborella trichopoda]